ncbi:hypothetical protein ACN19N_02100 [Acinetobacter sp. LF10]|jgi:hypothetical protein|uniref:hypothetical protein n=1 Tax=unclassified Acinetobacter TaxID=196816 RepID=UPI0022ABE57B|nr:hypothetical protein [Acinetobacter sp. TR3]WAU76269.1 hypothetical protein O1449_13550 [Acinetobacter sp. TR3]
MYTANRVFELQYSRFSFVLQLLVFVTVLILAYQLLALSFWLLSLVVMVLFWFLLLRHPLIKRFEYLDHQHWSFEFVDTSIPIQGRTITKIIDHQAYITIYFSDTQYQPLTIWWDQLSISQWQNLKLLIKML